MDDDFRFDDSPGTRAAVVHWAPGYARRRKDSSAAAAKSQETTTTSELGKIDALRIGHPYQTTYGTLWKDGTYFPRGTSVMVAGLHLDQGFCVRFPAEVGGEPLETWEDWDETDFLAEAGTIASEAAVNATVLAEAREVLDDADDGTHLHLHESDDA